MPYSSTSELPAATDKYSDQCKRAFMHAFNASYAEHGESRAFAIAHAAAQRCQEAHKSMPTANAVEEAANPKSAQFKIFSGALTPFDGGDGKKRLRTIASSSVEDLSGDVVTSQALQKMAESAKGMTVFRNHSYKVPQDILGTVEGATVKHSGTDGNQKPIHDLILDVVVMDSPENDQTYRAVESGVQLGTSIGAMIPPNSAKRGDNGGYVFDDLRLLEASIVGIPQNPRSWVQYAASAIKKVEEEDDDTNEGFHADGSVMAEAFKAGMALVGESGPETVEKGTAWMEASPDGGMKITVQTEAPEESKEQEQQEQKGKAKKGVESVDTTELTYTIDPDTGEAVPEVEEQVEPEMVKEESLLDDRDWANLPEGDQDEADALYAEYDELEKAADPDLVKATLTSEARSNLKESDFACPEKRKYPIHDKAHIRNALARCGDPSNDQCGCGKVRSAARAAGIGTEKDWEPDFTKQVEPDDTSEPQTKEEDDEEAPAQELGESAPESADTSDEEVPPDDTMARSADVLADVVKSLTRERSTLIKRAMDAEHERDEAVRKAKDAEENLRVAKEIVRRIATSPLGRKAVFRDAVDDFNTRLSGVYSPEFIKMLESKDHAD